MYVYMYVRILLSEGMEVVLWEEQWGQLASQPIICTTTIPFFSFREKEYYGLNYVSSKKRYAKILIPSTLEGELTWK